MTDSSVRESVVMSFDLKTSLQRPSGKALGLARRIVFVCTVGVTDGKYLPTWDAVGYRGI